MRVLLINHFPLAGSGSGTYTGSIAEYLAKRGHQVCVIFPETRQPEEIPGVRLHPVYFSDGPSGLPGALPFLFPCFTTHPRSALTFGELTVEEWTGYLHAFKKALLEEVSCFRPDIIHAQHLWCLSALAAEFPVPCVATVHGTDLMGFERWPSLRHYAREAADRCDLLLSISRDNYQSTVKMFPQTAEKIQLLQNGYNDRIFYREDVDRETVLHAYGLSYHGEQIVLFAGKLTAFKGVDILLYAAERYEAEGQRRVLTLIAGSGEEESSLKALSRDLKLGRVHFLGHVDQEALRSLYSIADVCVVPSRKEPFGLVALEAMACGSPVVATDEGGLPDFVTSRVGRLVPGGDPQALSGAIQAELAVSNAERKKEIAVFTRNHYAQDIFVDRLERIYREVCENRNGRTGNEEDGNLSGSL